MLFVARAAGERLYHPWEKYITQRHKVSKQVTASQVQRSFHLLTCQIGTPAKRPNIRGKPLGRQLGEKQIKRKRHPVIIKSKIAEKAFAA